MTEPLLPEVPLEGAHFRTYQGEHDLAAIAEIMRASLQADADRL